MLKGFKDFIMRGNVVDLAVGIVIGAAFTAVVTAFTTAFLKPLIQLLSGGQGVSAGAFKVRGVAFDWASFINACITFVLIAAVLYFLVVFPLNRLAERRGPGRGAAAGRAQRRDPAAHRDPRRAGGRPGRPGCRERHPDPRPASAGAAAIPVRRVLRPVFISP
jgi:large conductance mechanosensitive channel protein